MRRELRVEHREVGLHEVIGRQVLVEQLAKVAPRLAQHRVFQVLAELRVELAVRVVRRDSPQLQPLAEEILDEPLGPRVRQHAVHFRAQGDRLLELPARGQRGQFLVGHRVPQEVREAAGEGVAVQVTGRFDVEQEVRGAEGRAVRPPHRHLEAVARFQPGGHALHVLLAHVRRNRPAERARQEVREQAVGVFERLLAGHRPDAFDRVGLVLAHEQCLAVGAAQRRAHAGVGLRVELRDRQFAEQPLVSGRRPRVVQRPFHVEEVARDAGAGEGHRAPLAGVVRRRCERRGVEPDRLARVQPRDDFVLPLVNGGRVVVAENRAGVTAAAPVPGELYDRQACRFGAARRQHLPLVPLERPQRSREPVAAGVDGDELVEVRAERLVLVAEQADARAVAERPHALVRALVEVAVFAGRREVRVRLLVLEQHPVAVHQDVRDEPVRVRERDALLDRLRGARPGGDGRVENAVGGFEVLREVHMRQVEGVGVLVEPVNLTVRREVDLERQAGQVEQVADGVLVLAAGEPPEPRLAVGGGRLPLGRDEVIM